MASIVALIPARAGSKRVPGKNTRLLGGKPLIQWTGEAAIESGVFADIVLVTDDYQAPDPAGFYLWNNALSYHTPKGDIRRFRRSPESATDDAPDILWVREVLDEVTADAFAILRPTSPFRTAETIRRAWQQFQDQQPCDSLRAVEPVKQHPMKMWTIHRTGLMTPIFSFVMAGAPAHSCPTQTLPTYYAQNASLEIAWTRVVQETGTISGHRIVPFLTQGDEGFDINTEDDWREAERTVCQLTLP